MWCMMLGLVVLPFLYTKVKVSGWRLAVAMAATCWITSSDIGILVKLCRVTMQVVFNHKNLYLTYILLQGTR